MATKHPYVTANKGLNSTITHLRSSFPPVVTAATLKRLGFAPNNESYVINVLRFVGIIDDDGNGTQIAKDAFLQHDDAAFQQRFRELVQSSYVALFDVYQDGAWQQSRDKLIQFFRSNDETTANVGQLQAKTFSLLSQFAGYEQPKASKSAAHRNATRSKTSTTKRSKETAAVEAATPAIEPAKPQIGLTVRIEINLPADGSKETYDHIFKSIRENFLDG